MAARESGKPLRLVIVRCCACGRGATFLAIAGEPPPPPGRCAPCRRRPAELPHGALPARWAPTSALPIDVRTIGAWHDYHYDRRAAGSR